MKAIRIVLPALCVGLATPPAVNAQGSLPLSVEGRAGVSLPMGDFGDLANPSYGLGATVVYDLAPMIGIRAGYNYQRFGVDEEESGGADAEYTDSGFALGLELNPVLAPGLDLLLHADAILHQFVACGDVQIAVGWEVQESEWSVTSDHRFGFDVLSVSCFRVFERHCHPSASGGPSSGIRALRTATFAAVDPRGPGLGFTCALTRPPRQLAHPRLRSEHTDQQRFHLQVRVERVPAEPDAGADDLNSRQVFRIGARQSLCDLGREREHRAIGNMWKFRQIDRK